MWVQYLLSVIHPEQQQDRLHLCSGHTRNQITRLAAEHLGHPEGWIAWVEVLSDNDITKQNFDFKCNDIHSIYVWCEYMRFMYLNCRLKQFEWENDPHSSEGYFSSSYWGRPEKFRSIQAWIFQALLLLLQK